MGEDRIFGQQGDDVLYGGRNNDCIDGGPGRDLLKGGDGDDKLWDRDGEIDSLLLPIGEAGQQDVVFVFGARPLIQTGDVVNELRGHFKGAAIVGCSTSGEIESM